MVYNFDQHANERGWASIPNVHSKRVHLVTLSKISNEREGCMVERARDRGRNLYSQLCCRLLTWGSRTCFRNSLQPQETKLKHLESGSSPPRCLCTGWPRLPWCSMEKAAAPPKTCQPQAGLDTHTRMKHSPRRNPCSTHSPPQEMAQEAGLRNPTISVRKSWIP